MNALSSKGFTLYNMRYDFVKEPWKHRNGKHVQRIPIAADLEPILREGIIDGTIALGRLEMAAICAMTRYFGDTGMEIDFNVDKPFTVSSPNGSIAVLAREHDKALGIYNVIPATPLDWYWLNSKFKMFRHNRAHAEAGSRMQEIHEHHDFLATSMNAHQVWTNERLNTEAPFNEVTVENLQSVGFTVWGQNNDERIPVHPNIK